MQKLSGKNLLLVGFTLFSMFFGAGNLIFPPHLGAQAGTSLWPAFAGLAVSAVGLPIAGVVAVARAGGLDKLAGRVHPVFAMVFTILVYLSIGPCLAIPRTASTSFQMLVPLIGGVTGLQLAYSALFFAAAFLPGWAGWGFFLAFSIPAGLGTAFLYPSIQSCAQKWYAGRKGLATGVIGGAVGLSGAFLAGFVRTALKGFGPVQGIRGAFWALGALTLPVCLVGSALLTDPPPAKQKPEEQGRGKGTPALDLAPLQMLRTKQYWLCAGAVCCSTPAVLLFSPIILKLGMERGLDETAALWSIVLGSVGSAAGRMLMPMLSDHIGRRATDLGLFAASLALSAAFWAAQGWWVVVCYAGLTFCYSALAAVLPALSTDLFGLPHAGVNYGFLALGQSVGSLAFPFAANLLALENGRHLLAMAGAAAGFAAIWALHPVQKDPR